MPYVSETQIEISVKRLSQLHVFFGFCFLALKKADLPVGEPTRFSYSYIQNSILDVYFDVAPESGRYFNPFASSHPENKWVSSRYASTTLQRVMSDTFAHAFMHQKGSPLWGWSPNYVQVLSDLMRSTKSDKIPVLDLAVWLFKDREIPSARRPMPFLVKWLLEEFHITGAELEALCSEYETAREVDLAESPAPTNGILNRVGWPEGMRPITGMLIDALSLTNVGPVEAARYEPASRLNLIVGDNSVGKTFLLEALWWTLTDSWAGYAAEPRDRNYRATAEIEGILHDRHGYNQRLLALYEPKRSTWQRSEEPVEGFGIYSRHDGSVAVWDSIRAASPEWRGLPDTVVFSKNEIWDGKQERSSSQRSMYLSDGLVRDLPLWMRGRSQGLLDAFTKALSVLAKGTEIVGLGDPTKVPGDTRSMPTVRMPYGDVPVVFASAGTQRCLSIAYMAVLSWREHVRAARSLNRDPITSIVVVLDELEAHLHPKWQRTILPSIIELFGQLSPDIRPQFHVATHSPLVLTSAEPLADLDTDALHRLILQGASVTTAREDFPRHGTVDAWLTSEAFELASPRSLEGQSAIAYAENLMERKTAKASVLFEADKRLRRTLPDDDEFWFAWNYFKRRSARD